MWYTLSCRELRPDPVGAFCFLGLLFRRLLKAPQPAQKPISTLVLNYRALTDADAEVSVYEQVPPDIRLK